jgi:hypothetical protein
MGTAMTAARKLPPLMTVDDFLAWPGDGTATRYELVDGVLRAMAPTTNAHGIIQSNPSSLRSVITCALAVRLASLSPLLAFAR